jgi:hypothetical protein
MPNCQGGCNYNIILFQALLLALALLHPAIHCHSIPPSPSCQTVREAATNINNIFKNSFRNSSCKKVAFLL